MDQSRHSNAREQYDMRQLYTMLQQSQEHNENLKNIVDDLKKQLKEYKYKFEQSSKENEQLKQQNQLYSSKNEIYVLRINTFEESEQNLKQKISDISGKYDYLKGKYQELSKKYKLLESQNLAYQQSKKENDQPLNKIETRIQTNPGNDDSPTHHRQLQQNKNSKQQLSQLTKNQNLKNQNSIDLTSQNGSIQDIDKYAFQVLKQQLNPPQNSLTPQNQSGQQNSSNDINQSSKSSNQLGSQQQISNGKIQQQDNSQLRKQSLSPRQYSQYENNNPTLGVGVQQLKNNYINQMQSTTSNQTPIRSSTSVPALFRAPKNEAQNAQTDNKVSPLNQIQKNNEIIPQNSNQKSHSDIKKPPQKSLLFPQNISGSNYHDEGQYTSLNKYSSNPQNSENLNDQSATKIGEVSYTSNIFSKPPIMKKNDQTLQLNQAQLDQQKQLDLNSGYGRINSHRATIESVTPTHQNFNSYDSHHQQTKYVYPTLQHTSGITPQSNISTTITGDQSYMSNSQGQNIQQQQYMSQSSKYAQQQGANYSLSSSINHKFIPPSNSSLSSYQPSNPSLYDATYSESSFTNSLSQAQNKEMYSSTNSRNHPNRYHSSQDSHMYKTNPQNSSVDYNSQVQYNQNVQINPFNKSIGLNNSANKPQGTNGQKTIQAAEFSNHSSFNHQIPRQVLGDSDRFNPHSETKIDSEVHTPQKPNIFQSKSVFNNNQLNVQPHTTTNVNSSSVYKENDFAEHLISNDGIQVKKRSQVLHASRRDPNTTGQYSPSSPKKQQQSQYEEQFTQPYKQLMKALFGNDHQNIVKESGIPRGSTKNQDKMFELSQRVENEFDSSKNQDRVIPSMNPGFTTSSNNYSLSNSNNNSYNQQQIEKRSQSIKNLSSNYQLIDSESLTNLESTNDHRQKLRTSERNNNNLKTIQIQPFGQNSTHSLQGSKYQKMLKIIDNFMVISANQEKTRQLSKQNVFNVDQEIIYKAAEPKNDMENEQLKVISKFCFPYGVEVHKYKKENLSLDILKMISSDKKLQSKEYFVFPIKSAESFEKKNNNQQTMDQEEGLENISNPNKFIYCVCVVDREFIDPVGNQQRMIKSENNTQPQHYYQASSVYCIITKYPFFNFFFELILQFINKMNASKKNLIKESQIKNKLPSAQDYQQIDLSYFHVNYLIDFLITKIVLIIKKHINQGVLKVIQSCMKGEIVLDFNKILRFNDLEFTSLQIPQKEDCYLLEGNWGVMQTLTIMNVYEFLYILFSFLLEDSLVFLSKNPSTLSQTVMMFLSALKPFKWPHPLVMFLTNDLMHMFDSPFPLIIGINKSYDFIKENKLYKTHSHCIFVNLDEFGISEKKESIYQSNTYTTLTQRIKGDYEQLKIIFNKKDAYNDYSQELIQISCTIFDKIRKFFNETLNKLLPLKPILDAKNNLDYDEMKNVILKNCQHTDQFIEKFIQTQIFIYFLEEHYNV